MTWSLEERVFLFENNNIQNNFRGRSGSQAKY